MMRETPVSTRPYGLAAFGGVYLFASICLGVQFARTDLNWMTAPLSYYLNGTWGDVVQSAYIALAGSLAIVGMAFYRGAYSTARSAAPLLLFEVGAVALAVTALSETAKRYGNAVLWEMIHLAAAETTFLCVTVAMLLQSWWLRRDARWRGSWVFAFGLAAATFVALWIYALGRSLPRGLSQKTVIAMILFWLGWASLALWRRAAR